MNFENEWPILYIHLLLSIFGLWIHLHVPSEPLPSICKMISHMSAFTSHELLPQCSTPVEYNMHPMYSRHIVQSYVVGWSYIERRGFRQVECQHCLSGGVWGKQANNVGVPQATGKVLVHQIPLSPDTVCTFDWCISHLRPFQTSLVWFLSFPTNGKLTLWKRFHPAVTTYVHRWNVSM